MAHTQPSPVAKSTSHLAVATKPVHVGIISHLRTALFSSLHAHASHAVNNAAVNTGDESVFSDPVISHIITDLEKMIEKKFAAYEATQRGNVIAAQAAAKAAEPIVKPVAVVCPSCQVHSQSVDLSHEVTHPNTPEAEHVVVHSLPMEVEEHSVEK
jgi:hypothetical protein